MSRALAVTAPVNVAVLDEPGPGGAHHHYAIQFGGPEQTLEIRFQRGPRGEAGSTAGIFEDALLAILEDRMACFMEGPYACVENARALDGIQEARAALAERVAKRQAQGVLGKNAPHTS